MLNVLFVCSKNKWRSPTAESIYRNDERMNVRSAGISSSSKHRISERDIEWADLIFTMEEEHKSAIKSRFQKKLRIAEIYVLDIPDDYSYMDEELIEMIRSSVEACL